MSLKELIFLGLVVAAIAFVLALISMRIGPAKAKPKSATGDGRSSGDSAWFSDGDCGGDGGGD